MESNNDIGRAFFIDIECLFYSVARIVLFQAVWKCIEDNGDVSFHNSAGLIVDRFLVLLEYYLNSTFIQFKEDFYVPKQGICISSCGALILCNAFLSEFDRAADEEIDRDQVVTLFRYVDDFLVLLKKRARSTHVDAIADLLHIFQRLDKGWTHELTKDNNIQYLATL